MPERTLPARVENLEREMASLEGLPERVSAAELRIVHLRGEMHEQFSAVRQEIQAVRSELGGEIQTLRGEFQALRGEFQILRVDLRTDIEVLRSELRGEIKAEGNAIRSDLRAEIQAGDEETRRYMCVLHEEVLARIAAIQEGRARRRRR